MVVVLNDCSTMTGCESAVLILMCSGVSSNRALALSLHVSDETVKTHTSNLLRKLDVEDRTQAVAKAFRSGLVAVRPS